VSEDPGHYRCYVPKKFGADAMILLGRANEIIHEYEGKGYSMTLRQLYYQLVTRNVIPNEDRAYDRLGTLISDGRLAGLVSWRAIEDRTRYTRDNVMYSSPTHAVASARAGYKVDLWRGQPFRPVVGVEKDAMIGVIGNVCHDLRVPFCSFRGYSSQSQQWRLGQQLAGSVRDGQRPILFHLGDHDPSGLDMTRDNRERLSMFAGVDVQVVRLALNRPQVDRYRMPPNPAKLSDARATAYVAEHGSSSWELDALPPDAIAELISDAVRKVRDETLWSEALAQEAADKDELDRVLEDMGGNEE
jgi:hypothetical protein